MHKHHIIPKHMGGSDDEDNIIELSVEEHAEAHRILFEKYGCWQDEIAWKGLAGMIEKDEIIRRIQSEAAKERIKKSNPFTGIRTEYNFAENEEWRKLVSNLAQSPEAKKKRKDTFAKIKHQQGSSNSNFGKRWIHSLELKKNKCIPKNDPLPDNWLEGRKMKFVEAN